MDQLPIQVHRCTHTHTHYTICQDKKKTLRRLAHFVNLYLMLYKMLSPLYFCKCRRTVFADTCCLTNNSICWLRVRDLVIWSINAMRIRCLFSQLLLIVGHWAQLGVPYDVSESIDSIFCRQSWDLDRR